MTWRISSIVLVVGALALAPARALRAQDSGPDTSAAKQPMDPENPIAFMLLHRSELKLVDSQTTQLGNIGTQLTMRNRPLRDSLNDLRPPGDKAVPIPVNLTPAQRDSVFATRRAAARVFGEIHDNARAARDQALAVLSPDQQNKLRTLEQNLEEQARMSKMRPSGQRSPPGSMGGGQPGGYGGRPY